MVDRPTDEGFLSTGPPALQRESSQRKVIDDVVRIARVFCRGRWTKEHAHRQLGSETQSVADRIIIQPGIPWMKSASFRVVEDSGEKWADDLICELPGDVDLKLAEIADRFGEGRVFELSPSTREISFPVPDCRGRLVVTGDASTNDGLKRIRRLAFQR